MKELRTRVYERIKQIEAELSRLIRLVCGCTSACQTKPQKSSAGAPAIHPSKAEQRPRKTAQVTTSQTTNNNLNNQQPVKQKQTSASQTHAAAHQMDPQNQTTSSTAAAANNSTADASSNNSSSAHVNPNTSTTGNSNSNATETANSNSNGKFIETADSNGNGNTILNGNAYSSANGNPSTNSSGNGASASASIAAHSSASSSASATLDRSAARLALGRSTTASETLLSAASASTAVPPTTLSPAAATTAPEKLPKLLGADLEADRQSVCSIEDDPESASSSLFIPMSASRWMPSNNRVTTTKYTFLSFLPKNLAYQFSNIANIYFLGLILLQTVPELKIVDVSVTALPLILILTATAAKVVSFFSYLLSLFFTLYSLESTNLHSSLSLIH